MDSFVGRRIEFNGDRGTVRYYGPLQHDPEKAKGGEIWVGIEWDNPARGKHNGTVNGFKYFVCEYTSGASTGGSLIKFEKANFGVSLPVATGNKYKKYDEMNAEEKAEEGKAEQEMYVNTTKKDKRLTVQFVGKSKAYAEFSDLGRLKEVALQNICVSSIDDGSQFLSRCLPNLQALYLDLNLLYDWSQYFEIIGQLRGLQTLSLTDNRFRRPSPHLIASLPKDRLVSPSLRVLSLIGMALDWADVDVLLPSFELLEELWLCRNRCSKISGSFKVRTEYMQNLKILNLEDNHIESWKELDQFQSLPKLNQLVLTSNQIREVPLQSGFKALTYLCLEKNLVDNYASINNMGTFPHLQNLRISDNPLESIDGKIVTRLQIIARLKSLEWLNSSRVRAGDRRNAELTYLKRAWEEFSKSCSKKEDAKSAELLSAYMSVHHPRWGELTKQYGNPAESQPDAAKSAAFNIESTSVTVTLQSMCKNSVQKDPVKKKLPETITVGALKGICAKLFGVDTLKQRLSYHADSGSFPYDLDDNLRQLNYYAVRDGSEIWIHDS